MAKYLAYICLFFRRIHTGERPFVCHCGMAFRKKFVLKVHEKNCELPNNMNNCICRFCQISPLSYADLITHVTEQHTGRPETRCQFCTAKFKNAISLVIHEYRHQLPNVIKCETCNRIFKNEAHLNKHKRVGLLFWRFWDYLTNLLTLGPHQRPEIVHMWSVRKNVQSLSLFAKPQANPHRKAQT